MERYDLDNHRRAYVDQMPAIKKMINIMMIMKK